MIWVKIKRFLFEKQNIFGNPHSLELFPPPNIILKYLPCTVTTDKDRLADECRRSFALVLRVVYCGKVRLHVRP